MRNARLTITTSSLALAFGALFAMPATAQTTPQTATPAPVDAPAATQSQTCPDANQDGTCDDDVAVSNPSPGTPAADNAIVVTGSRISRPNFDTIEPAVVLSTEQIEARGFETLGQALNELPAFGVPGSSPVGGQAGGFGSGQSFVNFLGLGSERTLTLVNGRRFVGSNTASIFGPTGQGGNQVDLNVINTKLVERVETIVIGGAPIYGSDAIAGTVNVILKRNYEGFSLDGQYGISERGDAANYRFRGIGGLNFGDGRGNIVVSGEYNRGEGFLASDRAGLFREFSRQSNDPNSPFTNVLFRDRTIPSISEFGIPTIADFIAVSPGQRDALLGGFEPAFTDAQGRALRFDGAGNLIPINFGSPTGPLDAQGNPTTFEIDFAGGNGFSLIPLTNLLTDTERYNANLLGSFELAPSVRLFGEAWYSRSKGVNLRDQPEYNSYLFGYAGDPAGAIPLSVNNPFLTAQAGAIIRAQADGDTFLLQRANTDIVSGRQTGRVELYRFVAGIDGKFKAFGGRDWNYELVGNYGRSETNGASPVIVTQNFNNAVNAVRDASGNIVCAPGAVNSPTPTISSTCAPLNLFGQQASQAARDYVTAIARPVSVNKQKVVTASVSGPLFALPGGDLSIALGAEHREESQDFNPGEFFRGGPDTNPLVDSDGDGDPANDFVAFGQSVVIAPVRGKFNTDEVFGELNAALINSSNNIPFIYSLELKAAARYVDNSNAGGDLTWTAGGSWQPIRDITFRGNFTRAIRAPFITEAFNPRSSFFGFATDPCDSTQLNNGPDPARRRANCLAAGIPANFSSQSDNASFLQAVAGNPNLDNEKSDAWTIGTVLRPRFLRNFNATVDYVDIKVRDVITQFSADQVLNACYDSPDFPNSSFCSLISRAADDQVEFVETAYFNAAQLRYKGILAALDYRTNTPFLGTGSSVALNVSYQYLDTLTSRAEEGAAPTTTGGSIGYSRHQAAASLSYNNSGFGAFAQLNYFGKAQFDVDAAEDFQTPRGVGDVVFVNTGISFDVNKKFGFRFVVDNVFDTRPPFPAPAVGGTITYFPGVLGRYFRVGATVGF
jgi:outer membrane receptor protein involved in Fe transport